MRQIIIFLVLFTACAVAKEFFDPVKMNQTLTIADGTEGVTGECLITTDNNGTSNWDTCPGGGNTFADDLFRVQDNADATKQIALEASGITTATTRTVTMPDTNVDLADIATNTSGLAGKANTNLDNLSSVAFTTDLLPSTDNTRDLGALGIRMAEVHAEDVFALNVAGNGGVSMSDIQSLPSGGLGPGVSAIGADNLNLITANNGTPNANPTPDLVIAPGNKTGGTGDGGDIVLRNATSVGGATGTIRFINASEGTSGHVWTSSDTAGNGAWAAVPSAAGKADTDLGNLATTSINQNLIPDGDGTRNLGASITARWFTVNAQTINAETTGAGIKISDNSGAAQCQIHINKTTPSGVSGDGLFCINDETILMTDSKSGTNTSFDVLVEAGNCVNSVAACGSVKRRAGVSSGSAADGIIVDTAVVIRADGVRSNVVQNESLTADDQVITAVKGYIRVDSDNATPANRTFTIAAPTEVGSVIYLEWGNANAGELLDTGIIKLSAAWTPSVNQTLTLMSTSFSDWVEIARSDN